MITSIRDLIDAAREVAGKRIAVAWPHDADTLSSCSEAYRGGIVTPVLFGREEVISQAADRGGIDIRGIEIVPAEDEQEAAAAAVRMVGRGEADLLMKGLLDTKVILRAVLKDEAGLRSDRVLSHAAVFELAGYPRLLLLADAAMIISPSREEKQSIILNTVEVARALGIQRPKVALLCAKEKVDSKMPCTEDAAALAELDLPDCDVAGPLALDNAVSLAAAELKGISHPVAGQADVLIVPDIEAGNILYKALAFLAGARNAGIIVGAAAPIVLTSRADSDQTKLASIALAVLHAAGARSASPAVR
jgi:phosphate butyryltransferase